MRAALPLAVLATALGGCGPTPSITLEFPDAQAEAEAAELTLYALWAQADCGPLMQQGQLDTWVASVTARLPLGKPAHLGRLARGDAVFYAEVRDGAARPFLRACRPGTSGQEILLKLQRVARPVRLSEGATVEVPVGTTDANGAALKLRAGGLPAFASFDAAQSLVRLSPGFADQGSYAIELAAVESVPGAFTQTLAVTVEDVPRPLKWARLYRGWHGRFDAAALWDPDGRQLLVSGGRDYGVDGALPARTLYAPTVAQDSLGDFRALAFPADGGAPDWRASSVSGPTGAGKFGHVMGWVTSRGGSHARRAFVIGGSDGSQVAAEVLLVTVGPRVSYVESPTQLIDPAGAAFHVGMAAAFEPDLSKTYLFGGDLSLASFTADVVEVAAPTDTIIEVTKRSLSLLPRPSPRSRAAMVLALSPRRLVVIGGQQGDRAQDLLADAWVLCLEVGPPRCPTGSVNQWTQVINTGDTFPGSGSPGVFALAAGYDAPNDRVVTYGGLGVVGNQSWLFEDAFSLDLAGSQPEGDGGLRAAFTHLPAPHGPYGLVGAATAYEPDGGRLLLYGGLTGRIVNGNPQLDQTDDVWVLGLAPGTEKLTRLQVLGEPHVPTRRLAGSIIRTAQGPLMFGGEGEGVQLTDEWLVRGDGGVTSVASGGASPLPRANLGAVYNPDLDETWVYGGRVGAALPPPELFRYLADGGFVWHAQTGVDSRFSQANVYDEKNHRMIVFGGVAVNAVGSSSSVNDTLALTVVNDALVTKRLSPANPPSPRYGVIEGYEPAGQRMLIYGGTATVTAAEVDTNEVWELSLLDGHEAWRLITTLGPTPEPMYLPAGVWTRERPPRLYVVGTVKRPTSGGAYAFVDEVWRLTMSPGAETWAKLANPDFRPRPRVFPAFTYEPKGHQLLLSGGASDPCYRNDFWSLTLP